MRPTPVFRTERLVLRPLREEDAPAIQRILTEPHISRYTLGFPHPYPPGAALTWVRDELARREQATSYPWAITLPCDKPIGFIGLAPHEGGTDAHIGYWIEHLHWNLGYATEAVRAVIAFGLVELDLLRIEARCLAQNVASARVLQKAGMVEEGTLHMHIPNDPIPRDVRAFAITRPPVESVTQPGTT